MPITLPPAPSPPDEPAGHYGTLADLIAVAGEVNLKTYSNLDSVAVSSDDTLALDANRVQAAMDAADAQVSQYLRDNGLAFPAATNVTGFSVLTEAWSRIAVRWLYMARGAVVDTDESGAAVPNLKSNIWAKEARTLLAQFALGGRMRAFSTSLAFSGPDRPAGAYPCG